MSEAPALAGLRVVDLTRHIPGPYCTLLLADLGADVVKIEAPPFGDPTRAVPPAQGDDSAAHAALNRGKRSVMLDVRSDLGASVVRRLTARADVLVEGFRPGVMERLGLGAGALLAANPRLVYCSLSGYGQRGPMAARAGHDINYAARGGLLDQVRDGNGGVVVPGAQIADMAGGLIATTAILAALFERERSGRGRHLDVSLQGGILALMTMTAARLAAGGPSRNELSGEFACYSVYRCKDGREVAVGALEPKFWEALCGALGVPELVASHWQPGERNDTARQRLASIFATRDSDEWVSVLEGVDACVEPVLTPVEAQRAAPPGAERPLAASGLAAAAPRNAPRAGEHTAEVLGELGLSRDEIARVEGAGACA
jgi:crotonobetainyl-CoA:carnitine CoA-transferase CaiB-like acyl-CoA transferase